MDARSTTFVTIGNLVSPSSSVNWNPLFDFPDHWQPRFSAQFPLPATSEGADWPAPPNERSVRSRLLKPGRQAVGSVSSLMSLARQDVCSLVGRQLDALRTPWATLVFAGPAAGSPLNSNPVLDIFSVFAAALKIQLMSPASDFFSRWFSESNHCNLLGCQDCLSANRPPFVRCGLLAVC
jgi:hypothetical protein